MNSAQTASTPIQTMQNSLSAVYKFCTGLADPDLRCIAEEGIGTGSALSEAATLAHWISKQPQLMLRKTLEIYCPVPHEVGSEHTDMALQRTRAAMKAVPWLLGRDPESVEVKVVGLTITDFSRASDCVDARWRNLQAPPRTQCGDAVWLGYLNPESVHHWYIRSEDLDHVVHCGIPVGLAMWDERDCSMGTYILRLAGFHLPPMSLKQSLNEESDTLESYRHSPTCALHDSFAYTLTIIGASNPDQKADVAKLKLTGSIDWVHTHTQGQAGGISVMECPVNGYIVAGLGTIIKCDGDMNPQERYQVLTDNFMVRLSDGAVLHVSATDDLRGPQAFEIDLTLLVAHPGIDADWLSRSDWGMAVEMRHHDQLVPPLIDRDTSRRLATAGVERMTAGLSTDEAGRLTSIVNSVLPQNHSPVTGTAKVLFGLLDQGHLAQAKGLLLEQPDLIEAMDSSGDTPLMRAVQTGDVDLIKACLQLKANVNCKSDDGFMPLHEAARNGFTSIAEKLLDHGANIDGPTPLGWTPLLQAIQFEHQGCAKMLVRRGADTKVDYGTGSAERLAKAKGIALR